MVNTIWNKIIDSNKVFIIAEAGVNHNGSFETAKKLIDAAILSGASAVKFQTFCAKSLVSPKAPKADYQKEDSLVNESQLDMLLKLELKNDEWLKLYEYCKDKGTIFMSTPFDKESVDFLDNMGMEVFKISSGEVTNLPLLEYIASKKKPIILSTGMATLSEIETALKAIKDSGTKEIALLHCVSNYPAKPEDINLLAMNTLAKTFNVPVGYSDHTLGIEIAIGAVALGACIIEKHFTLSNALEGPDHKLSLMPNELEALADSIYKVKSALGNADKKLGSSETYMASIVRRSLTAACDIKAGTFLEEQFIAIQRPGTGLSPSKINFLIGRKAKTDIAKGTLLSEAMLI